MEAGHDHRKEIKKLSSKNVMVLKLFSHSDFFKRKKNMTINLNKNNKTRNTERQKHAKNKIHKTQNWKP